MSDDLETVSHLTSDIVLTMRNVTKKLQMGFGAFVDKPVFPFVVPTPEYLRNPCLNVGTKPLQCDPPFLFKHILSLTENFEEFKEKTQVTRPSGNLDSPEGGLDALLQVARCGDHIKWRANARKIVLFASDGGFHLAGDGRIAGLIRPPPTTCQLTYQADRFNSSLSYYGWHTADQTDYPSVGEIAQVLTEKDISVIFAVDSKLHALYTKLAAFLPSAAVGILSDSSTNIVRLLRDNYDKIANKAELMTTYDSDSLEVQVLTRCNHESGFTEKTVCNDHPVGGRIDYQISVKPKRCFAGKKTVSLKMVALDDQAVLEVEAACNCPTCQRLPTPDYSLPSSRCQSRGYLQCGSCRCHTGFSGDFCECSAETSAGGDAAMIVQCTQEGAKEPCSARGRCICGKCKCNLARYEGDYCECDRHGCKRASDDNQVCGGPQRGICQCDGTCVCKPGYTGDRCDCMKSVQQCIDPNNPAGPKCSGRGVCDCGQCFCNSGYTGHLCNEIQGGESALCTDREVERCVLCLRDSLVKAFDKSETTGADDSSIPPTINIITPAIHPNGEVVYTSPEYANAAAVCGSACNGTVIDTARVKLIDNNEQKDDSNLCIIYTDDSCRIFFTYRYSDAIYVNRKNSHRFVIRRRNGLRQIVRFTRPLLCWSDSFVEFLGLMCVLCRHCSSGVLRLVPPKPLWTRFDITLSAESGQSNETSASCGLFAISRSALPPRTELQEDDIKLLERLSLTDFGTEKCLIVLEEAIRYADPLLTEAAFRGTTNEERWSRNSIAAMYSLVDEIHPEMACPLRNDDTIVTTKLTTHLMDQAPLTWEGYFVAPPGNIPVDPKGVVRK
ncbi:hypothetical protein P879_05328 [Paragonimus westermani]|uniref:Integrin beta n=1 Tax=Paragonimus westermani TaxID=34504 RepID=A0A8T0DD63_9TREM|nr:hypothetical protein P879_05328 [Paragonimus westermani]